MFKTPNVSLAELRWYASEEGSRPEKVVDQLLRSQGLIKEGHNGPVLTFLGWGELHRIEDEIARLELEEITGND